MFRRKDQEIKRLEEKYGVYSELFPSVSPTPPQLAQLYIKYGCNENNIETKSIEKSNTVWTELVQYSYNGVPLCYDGVSGDMIRFAPNLEDIILNREPPSPSEFNPNTINFRGKDLIDLTRNFPSYLEFLRKNYTLATAASALGNKVDSPEFPFFNQISGLINAIGFVGANPVLAKKIHKKICSEKLQAEGKAALELYLPDRLLDFYQKILFERRATQIEISSEGRIIAKYSDYYLKGTRLLMEEFLNLAAVGAVIKIKSDEYVLATIAKEEPGGIITKSARSALRFARKIPLVGGLI